MIFEFLMTDLERILGLSSPPKARLRRAFGGLCPPKAEAILSAPQRAALGPPDRPKDRWLLIFRLSSLMNLTYV
jgi:hypothetical protein